MECALARSLAKLRRRGSAAGVIRSDPSNSTLYVSPRSLPMWRLLDIFYVWLCLSHCRSVVQTCMMDIVPVPGAGAPSPSSSSPAGAGDREQMDVNGDPSNRLTQMPEFMVSSVSCLFITSY